jgi:NDP-sugar pyrophosphorylase family protein
MLPVAGRPMIHHVVQEAVDAGIEEICIVIREGKESMLRYFEETPGGPSGHSAGRWRNHTDIRWCKSNMIQKLPPTMIKMRMAANRIAKKFSRRVDVKFRRRK